MRSDIKWLTKFGRRPWRRKSTEVMVKQNLGELVLLRGRVHQLAVELQCWREATEVGQHERATADKARLRMSQRGVVPTPLRDDDFKRAPND